MIKIAIGDLVKIKSKTSKKWMSLHSYKSFNDFKDSENRAFHGPSICFYTEIKKYFTLKCNVSNISYGEAKNLIFKVLDIKEIENEKIYYLGLLKENNEIIQLGYHSGSPYNFLLDDLLLSNDNESFDKMKDKFTKSFYEEVEEQAKKSREFKSWK